jgi:chemotaxis protein CheD
VVWPRGQLAKWRAVPYTVLDSFRQLHDRSSTLVPLIAIVAGEVAASATPAVLRTLLGSCVSVCLNDPATGIGGMNHILLPTTTSLDQNARVGVHAMEMLINSLMKLGADRSRLVAKCFGGANVLPCFQAPTVGDRNAEFVRAFLSTESIPIAGERLGGVQAIQVNFRVDTGRVILRCLSASSQQKLAREETRYIPRLQAGAGDVTLF